MSRTTEIIMLLAVIAQTIALACIADRLCAMEPAVTVQFMPQPESQGDKAAISGSE